MKKIMIKKYSGETEPYSEKKVKASLRRSGATDDVAVQVLKNIEKKLYNGITTREIYKYAKKELRDLHEATCARYSLREAISKLGPEGYPFEKYISRLLEEEGYKVKVNEIHRGHCITHEIDVCATKKNEKILIECKFHSKPWIMSSIQTALYVKARFEDLSKVYDKVILVTNTKFSSQVIDFVNCLKDFELIGWDYPSGNGLKDKVEKHKLWPITMVPGLKNREIRNATDSNILLLSKLAHMSKTQIAKSFQVNHVRADKLQKEAKRLIEELE